MFNLRRTWEPADHTVGTSPRFVRTEEGAPDRIAPAPSDRGRIRLGGGYRLWHRKI